MDFLWQCLRDSLLAEDIFPGIEDLPSCEDKRLPFTSVYGSICTSRYEAAAPIVTAGKSMATGSMCGRPVLRQSLGKFANRKHHPMTSLRLTRSHLAVPAHRVRMVERAASSDADAVLLDLDDAGPVEEKRATLDAAIRAITNLDWGSKVLAVRLNAVDTPLIDDQLDLLSGLKRLDSLLLRKVEQVNAVIMIGDRLSGKKRRSADSRGA